jgi:AcrR family transcriptional regulator
MPRTPEENERIKKKKKEQVLMAGLAVFAEKGPVEAKMSDIAKKAGVSYGLVYNYFPSKDQLLVELVNSGLSSSQELVDGLKHKALPPLERIRETFIRLFHYYSRDPGGGLFYRVMLQLSLYPRLWGKFAVKDLKSEPVFRFLFEAVKEGQQSGEIVRKNPREIVLVLGYVALSLSLSGHEMLGIGVIRGENIADLMVRMIKR